jgi:Xaa-Pro aminopeptidase
MRHAPIDPSLFTLNRKRLRELLPPSSLAVVNANDLLPVNADATLLMQPNSDLFYLSGIEQEETILLVCPHAFNPLQREILFIREPNALLKTWEGHKLSREEASGISGIKTVKWLSEFPSLFHQLMCEMEHVYLNSNEHGRAGVVVETRDARFVDECRRRYPLHDYRRLARLMHRLRVVKSPAEVSLMKKAAAITKAAFQRVCRFVQPGVNEVEIEAEFAHEFIRKRASFAYSPIIASGPNSCILHYNANDQVCRKGDLLLLDVGARYANYSSDLTRTIPVGGRFSKRQKAVYNAVLRVMRSGIAGAVAGKLAKDWQAEAQSVMTEELIKLGLLKPKAVRNQDPENPEFRRFFMHGLGHPLGLDVHDLGYLNEPFAPGWVMTVEPGIYLPDEGFGVRLENNVLITREGPVDLTADIPVEADEIESLVSRPRGAVGSAGARSASD